MKSRAQRLVDRAVVWPIRRPVAALTIALIAFGLAVWSLATARVDANVEAMLGGDAAATFDRVGRAFGWRERGYLLLEADAPQRGDDLVACAARIASELADDEAVANVEYGARGADDALGDRLRFPFGLLLLDAPDELDAWLTRDGIEARLQTRLDRLSLPGLGEQDDRIAADPLGLDEELAKRLRALRGGYSFAPGSPHYLSVDGRALLVVVTGHADGDAGSAGAQRMTAAIDAATERALAASPGISASATGAIYLAAESSATIRHDLTWSLSASIVLAILILSAGLGTRIATTALLITPTLWGATVGIGAFTALRDEVSVLSFACAAILIGLGIDFTIHVTVAARREHALGHAGVAAIARAFRDTYGRLALAAITSAAAFTAFLTSDAGFLRDMGGLTACGLFACLVSPYLLLPPLLLRMLRDPGSAPRQSIVDAVEVLLARRPGVVAAAAVGVTIVAAATVALAPPALEDDLRNLHAADSRPLAVQRRIGDVFGGSFDPVIALVAAADERTVVTRCARAERALRRLVDDGTLLGVTSIATIVPPEADQQRTLDVLAKRGAAAPTRLAEALDAVGFDAGEFTQYVDDFGRAARVTTSVTPSDLRDHGLERLVEPFVRPHGAAHLGLVMLQTPNELWTPASRDAVIGRARDTLRGAGVEASLTGMLPVAAESADLVASNFAQIAWLTIGAVVIVLALRFRRPFDVARVLVPATLGALCVGAFMSWTGGRLNLMNLGVIPMVLALGIDDGIHIGAHFATGRRRSTRDVLQTTGRGVLLTSVTTMVTFGSLALSTNRGLASVGALSFVGIGGCLVASLLVLPLLFDRNLRDRQHAPIMHRR